MSLIRTLWDAIQTRVLIAKLRAEEDGWKEWAELYPPELDELLAIRLTSVLGFDVAMDDLANFSEKDLALADRWSDAEVEFKSFPQSKETQRFSMPSAVRVLTILRQRGEA